MPQDGQNTNSATNVVTPSTTTTERTTISTTTKEEIKRLENIQDKVWALNGLKMACDRLRELNYDVVVVQKDGRTTIELELKVDFDFNTGMVGGRDMMVVQDALEKQIKELKGK
jgi:hypothetical protein